MLVMDSELPVLYSFRRCPYAMRARMAIVRANFLCQNREVVLRDRPLHMMEISPKGTVPVLQLADGVVIEESLDIMKHVSNWCLNETEKHWVDRNDNEFKTHLDRYKYPNRYENIDSLEQRELAKIYLDDLDRFLATNDITLQLSDALFPFVRQFANHDRNWFDNQPWDNLHDWLRDNLESEEFSVCMKKYPQWHEGDDVVIFPLTE